MKLPSPHVPLGIPLAKALELLQSSVESSKLTPRPDGSLGISSQGVELALYVTEEIVSSVWYNDPTGRESGASREAKVAAYLSRYGDMSSWERRMDNGWMHYWFNEPARAAMVYGLHMDVVRFNTWHPPASEA